MTSEVEQRPVMSRLTAFSGLCKLFEGGKLDATKFIEKVCFTTNISNLHFTVDIANKKYALKLKLL